MRLDNLLVFSDDQDDTTVTTHVSDSVVDLGVGGDAIGRELWLDVHVTTKCTSDGAATVRWTGTANTAFPLAVATAATNTTSKWGWYQIQGAAIVNISGTVTAGNKTYFGQVATLETNAAVAGKQVLNIQASSADGVPETGKAIFTLQYPMVQSAIT